MTQREAEIAIWRERSAAAMRAVATKRRKYKKWHAHRGPQGLRTLQRVECFPDDCECGGPLRTSSESSRQVGGGAAQLFKVSHKTKKCRDCARRYQVCTVEALNQ